MEHSPTEQITVTPASQVEPTGQEQPIVNSAESNQETSSGANPQESGSDDTAQVQQTKSESGSSTTDDGLAKFAQSQGFDYENISEDVKRALKIAHDNQKAFRERGSQKITDATKPQANANVEDRVAHLEYEAQTDKFFAGKDRSHEAKMIEILNQKREQYGDAYAYNLSRDLDTLYSLATSGASQPQAQVDPEAIRREERESINRQNSASAPTAHASASAGAPKAGEIDDNWIRNEYNPRDPEHRKLVDEYYSR